MGFFPTKDDVEKEVKNYDTSSFFYKSKNLLVLFVSFCALMTYFVGESLGLDEFTVYFAIFYNLFFAIFIYLNHRWAMVLFCLIFTLDKILIIYEDAAPPLFQIIFGLIGIILTITSFQVASKLKLKNISSDRGNINYNQYESTPSISNKIRELNNLKEQGLISEDDYQQKKKSLLDEM